eukprot:447270-Prymnesium_polylepis.1
MPSTTASGAPASAPGDRIPLSQPPVCRSLSGSAICGGGGGGVVPLSSLGAPWQPVGSTLDVTIRVRLSHAAAPPKPIRGPSVCRVCAPLPSAPPPGRKAHCVSKTDRSPRSHWPSPSTPSPLLAGVSPDVVPDAAPAEQRPAPRPLRSCSPCTIMGGK